ncbi:hypothetical protein [Sphingomicrobium astaxanthinifaciens]|uniref:hypothetical protein n=1 Tax=Sphingomicrobium astaxanthinifaciens TaxID=1227949 RepID=UPI001FCBB48C|nr:hypothetical protein [Sphingomicrobium astaxanthinifaciens]MCJ7420788.1 hypothetical protein [Sphingomicrobium astaxanthinifaciens]
MSNDDRLAAWRKQQAIEPPTSKDKKAADAAEEKAREEARKQEAAEALLPSAAELEAEQAEAELRRAEQRRVRRRRMIAFVALPTLLLALYYAVIARPLYEAEATFTISTVAGSKAAGGVGLLAGVTGGSELNDDYRVREYLLSREAMLAMQREHGFLDHFAGSGVDFFGAPREIPLLGIDAHDFYLRRIDLTVDMQESLLHLKVRALTPEKSAEFAAELLELGAAKVASMSDRLNRDQIEALERDFAEAEGNVREANARVAAIQRRRADVDPAASAANAYSIIANFEVQLAEVESERQSLLANGLTESPLLPRLDARARALRQQIARQRERLVGGRDGSVQRTLVDFEAATAQKQLAESNLESILRTLEAARLRALEQRRYLLVIARPVAPSIAELHRVPRFVLTAALLALLAYGLLVIGRRLRALRTA